jgi:hypothetical protein
MYLKTNLAIRRKNPPRMKRKTREEFRAKARKDAFFVSWVIVLFLNIKFLLFFYCSYFSFIAFESPISFTEKYFVGGG